MSSSLFGNRPSETMSFCSKRFPVPRTDHDLILMLTTELKSLHNDVREMRSEIKTLKEESAAKDDLLKLSERVQIVEKNSSQLSGTLTPESATDTAIAAAKMEFSSILPDTLTSPSPLSLSPPKATTPSSTPVAAPGSTVNPSTSTETDAEDAKDARKTAEFIAACEARAIAREEGRSYFITVAEIEELKREALRHGGPKIGGAEKSEGSVKVVEKSRKWRIGAGRKGETKEVRTHQRMVL